MKVSELIVELQKYSADAEVFLRDPDTDWKMPIHVVRDAIGRGWAADDLRNAPTDVALTGNYGEAISDRHRA